MENGGPGPVGASGAPLAGVAFMLTLWRACLIVFGADGLRAQGGKLKGKTPNLKHETISLSLQMH